ncbi:MAG: nucleoid-associated protein [Gammaproteobacteria bacterium]|uniref:nucleoid-associated protein n=1 Tax=Pseudomaricurvus alcaniphilus TaxID=1166482 RepID=UPI00140A8E30|nr:nucleoid-associated protein [Pseudomaricurvus alcaniphilus]MBR9911885.1 nucleoid-associated protein [Gammaproteobacteria bacterium]NHN36064.1 nucleoid-associated protein [Pseudomaricurvus alcaniphilus]
MPFTHSIGHAISRSGTEAPLQSHIRDQEFPVSGYLDELLRELKHAFQGKAGKQYGQFHSDAAIALVCQWLRQFRQEKMGFQAFTKKAVEHLQSLLADTEIVVDGHLLFTLESLADGDYLYVFFVVHNEGIYLDGDLNLEISRALDVKGVLWAAKVNLTDWESEDAEGSYLAVLRARGDKDLTEQLWKWIGFADQRDIAAETNTFLDAVSAYVETLEPEAAQTYRHKVVDFCLDQDRQGEAVVIRELSAHIDDEQPERFASFMEARDETPRELIPVRRQLKEYVRISGRNDLLSMSFAAECLGDSVVYDRQDDSLTIRNIPAPLKLRLIKHMQKLGSSDTE